MATLVMPILKELAGVSQAEIPEPESKLAFDEEMQALAFQLIGRANRAQSDTEDNWVTEEEARRGRASWF